MMVKIFLDAGHGGHDPGAVFGQLQEKQLTLKLATFIRQALRKEAPYMTIKMSRTTDQSISLAERVRLANEWKADLFISLHVNSGGGTGYEDFIHSSLNEQTQTAKIRNIFHWEVTKHNGLRNRGKKRANFYVLRETKMPAILTENGFIDSAQDRKFLQSNRWMKKVAQGYAKGIIKAFQQNQTSTKYYVITGSFKRLNNAKQQVNRLKKYGFKSIIKETLINGQILYRVIAGTFNELSKAKKRKRSLQQKGFSSFISI